jgi:hypothetical protein
MISGFPVIVFNLKIIPKIRKIRENKSDSISANK